MANDRIGPRDGRANTSMDLSSRLGDYVFFVRDWLFKARTRFQRWCFGEASGHRAGSTQLVVDMVALVRSGQLVQLARQYYWLPLVLMLVVVAGYFFTIAWFDAMRS